MDQLTETLDPHIIKIPERLRKLTPEHVDQLVESFKQTQWVSPINVLKTFDAQGDENYTLIAGYHRLEACKRLGLSIPVIIETDSKKSELLEIVENYTRLELSASEKLEHSKRLITIYQEQGYSKKTVVAKVAEKLNQSKATVRRDLNRSTKIGAKVLDRIRGTHLDRTEFLGVLAGMANDEARMRRIDLEEAKGTKPGRDKDDELQAANWIVEIFYSALTAKEIARIKSLLELTDRRVLISAIENYNKSPQEI